MMRSQKWWREGGGEACAGADMVLFFLNVLLLCAWCVSAHATTCAHVEGRGQLWSYSLLIPSCVFRDWAQASGGLMTSACYQHACFCTSNSVYTEEEKKEECASGKSPTQSLLFLPCSCHFVCTRAIMVSQRRDQHHSSRLVSKCS